MYGDLVAVAESMDRGAYDYDVCMDASRLYIYWVRSLGL